MKKLFFIILLLPCLFVSAQDEKETDTEEIPEKPRKEKGFQAGFFAGTYFPNKNSSDLYDGYGLDAEGNKNNFTNSAMNVQINVINGGNNGQPDRIAEALKVQHGEWFFSESDMPVNLKYLVAFSAGANLRYAFSKQSSLILNANTSRLTVNGNFTIVTQTLNNGNQQPQQIRTFPIIGTEQRLLMQFGYQHIFGDNDKMNFFAEGGLNITMAKMMRNQANINGLVLDLMGIYYLNAFTPYNTNYRSGVGSGAFAGLGLNITVGNKWVLQFVYSPTYELVKLGAAPKHTLNHAFGVRGYYCF